MAALTVERKAAVDTFDPTADGDCEPLRRALMLQQAKEVMQTTAWNLANGKTCRLDTGALGRLRLMLSKPKTCRTCATESRASRPRTNGKAPTHC